MKVPRFLKSYWFAYLVILALVEPLTWFSLGKRLSDYGPIVNVILLTSPAVIAAITLFVAHCLRKRRTKLTPINPVDTYKSRRLWAETSRKCNLTSLLREREATMLVTWPGIYLQAITARYDSSNAHNHRYDVVLPKTAQVALDAWQRRNPQDFQRLIQESWGLQVRLEKIQFDHIQYKYTIDLSPIKYLYYVSLQARLWHPIFASLRREAFENALSFLTTRSRPLLPNHFALHMAIVSSDVKLLIRQRSDDTELYPGVWEASIGEFMHGPEHRDYPHFTEDGKPDLQMFCINAVAEETNYHKAAPNQFRVYGFGIEYRTLAPKMYVVYRSTETMASLLSQGQPKDQGKKLSSIELSPRSLGEALAPSSGYLWSPSSRIISLLALRESVESDRERESLTEEFMRSYRPQA